MAVELFTGIQICLLDMLPVKYLLIVLGLLVLVALLSCALLFRRQGKWQKKPGYAHRVIGCILSVIAIIGCVIASYAISKVRETVNAVTEKVQITAVIDVYVPKEDAAETVADAKDYTFAVTESFDWENTQKTLARMGELMGSEVKTVSYPSVFAMVDALYAGEVDGLIVNSSYTELFYQFEPYEDFTDRTKLLFEHNIEEAVPVVTEPSRETETTAATKKPQGAVAATEATEPKKKGPRPFIMYLSGSDTRSSRLYNSCSDVNILAVVNPQTNQILLVNTPRDYYIPNPAGRGALDKLTHCGLYGVECSVVALEDLYGIDIDYYSQINFTGFKTLIDAVGGVTVYSDVAFTSRGGQHFFQKGENFLDGEKALAFARERYMVAGGDNGRGKNQMKVIQALINKFSAGTLLTKYADILDSIQGMFITNMSHVKIAELVKMQIADMPQWNVQSFAVTGDGSSGRNYSLPSMDVYIMLPHEQKVAFAGELISRVLKGEILTEADMTP